MADSFKIELNTSGLGQRLENNCWEACARIMYRWKKQDPNTIQDKIMAAKLPYYQFMLSGLQDTDLVPVGGTLGFMGWNAEAVRGWDIPRFIQQLHRYGPHKVGFKSGLGKHAMVLHGATVKDDQLLFTNPMGVQQGEVGTDRMSLAEFRTEFNPVPFSVQSWQ